MTNPAVRPTDSVPPPETPEPDFKETRAALRSLADGSDGGRFVWAESRYYAVNTVLSQAEYQLQAARKENRRLRELCVDVANSGVEFEDDRISYVVIQVDPDTLAECRAIRDAVRSAQPSEIA